MTITADKKKLQIIGITAASILGFLALLIFVAILARSFRENGLRRAVEQVLSVSHPQTYAVGDEIRIQTPLTVSLAAFALSPITALPGNQNTYAVIVRVTGIAGSVPAVFVCSDVSASFAGMAGLAPAGDSKFLGGVTEANLSYWEKRLPAIIGKEPL